MGIFDRAIDKATGTPSADFGRRVKERREDLGWTQDRLMLEIGLSQRHLSYIELGKLKKPERMAFILAPVLQTTPEWLLTGHGTKGTLPPSLTSGQLVDLYGPMDEGEKREVSEFIRKIDSSRRKSR